MPCYHPITGYRSKYVNSTGKRSIVFNTKDGYADLQVDLPCGKCVGCRLEYSRQWAVRCMHEAQMHEANSFITLTFNEENIPGDQSIRKDHLQRFFKRLRKNTGVKFKYFACGEYGDQNHRPHYHAVIFGYDFPDRTLYTKTKGGHLLFNSETLDKAWQDQGYAVIGDVTFDSCAYVARYVMKKRKGDDDYVDPRTGKTNKEYYAITDDETGETFFREPEFCLMSRGSGKKDDPTLWRYGIGRSWLEKFKTDTDKDFITVNFNKQKLPKYYDAVLEIENELDFLERKRERKKEAKKRAHDNTPERLAVKETIKLASLDQLKRDI